MVKKGNLSEQYFLASILMLVFVLSDLVFDFLFSFTGSNYVSFVFTLLATLVTFCGNYGVVKFEITHKTDKISVFVRSVFNLPQIVFSILDVFCGIVSILSGLVIVGSIFKIAKILFIPARIATIANKGKTIFKALARFSLIWVIGRLLTNKYKGIRIMKTWIKNNKMTLAYCVIFAPLAGFVSYKLLPMWLTLAVWANVLIAVLIGFIAIALIILIGGDKVAQATFRAASKALNAENYNLIKDNIENLLGEQEIHELALERIAKQEKEEKLEQSNAKVKISEEEKNKLIEAEMQKILENGKK